MISYTMNKLIKRDFFPYTLFSFFPLSSFPQKSKICLREKKKIHTLKNVCVHRHTTTTKREGEGREREKGKRMSRQ